MNKSIAEMWDKDATVVAMKELPNGEYAAVSKLLFHYMLITELHTFGYERHYCYRNLADALVGMEEWVRNFDRQPEPYGWHKCHHDGRKVFMEDCFEWKCLEAGGPVCLLGAL